MSHLPSNNGLPPRLTATIAFGLFLTLVGNIAADVFKPDYSGYPTTVLLTGLLGGVLGIDRWIRTRGGSS